MIAHPSFIQEIKYAFYKLFNDPDWTVFTAGYFYQFGMVVIWRTGMDYLSYQTLNNFDFS